VNWLDYLLLFILAMSVIDGLRRGMARILIGLSFAILGVLFGLWFYGYAGGFLAPYIESKLLTNFLGFILVFLGFTFLGGMLGMACAKLFKWVGLSWADRLAGGAAGLLHGMVTCVVLVLILMAFPFKPTKKVVGGSRLAPYAADVSNVVVAIAPRELQDAFYRAYDEVKEFWVDAVKRKKQVDREKRTHRVEPEKL
jgi:membrane protein required for colicin V production